MAPRVLTAISLFSGVGGLDLGVEAAGFRTVLMCEADAYKRAVLAAHWPGVPIHDDVHTLDDHPHADLVHGGFPCQDVSVAGKRAGLAGERTGLFWHAVRVVDAVRPRAVLLENVPGLLSSQSGRDFAVVVDALADRGYGVAWRVLDAQHFGVPQRRRRVFVLAVAGDDPRAAAERAGAVLALTEGVRRDPAQGDEAGPDAAAGARGRADDRRVVGALAGVGPNGGWRIGSDEAAAGHLVPTVSATLKGQRGKGGGGIGPEETLIPSVALTLTAERGQWNDPTSGNLIPTAFHLTQDPISGSVAPAMGKGNAQGCATVGVATAVGVRRLMPVECERLMGWPDGHTAPPRVKAPDSRRYAACGDGVVAPVAEWIARRLADALRDGSVA